MSVVLDVLRELICDPAVPIDPDRLYAARRALHDDPSVLKTSDIELLASEAHAAFNASLQKREGGDADEVKRLTVATHVRTFCLSVISASTPDVRVLNDLELTQRARHWSRVGLQWVMCNNALEAEGALDEAARLLRATTEPESIEVLEIELQLLGFRAHLGWSRGQMRQVKRHLEDAHALVERRGGSCSFLLVGPRRYLAEHVAFILAHRGFELLDDGSSGGLSNPLGSLGSGGGGGGAAAGGSSAVERTTPFERHDLIRLLDLGLALLGDLGSEIDDVRRLRDSALRLRALLCIQENEIDLAAHALRQHSASKTDAFSLLNTLLLFRCNQPAEAQAHALDWLRSSEHMPGATATTLIDLFVANDAISAALSAIGVLTERLAQRGEWAAGSDEGLEYAELQEIKFRLLTERAPDSAAAAEHLETILDGHCSGRRLLEEATLFALASKLWAAGVSHYQMGDLFRTTSSFEDAYRFLEHTRDRRRQHRVQATIAHCYLLQERTDQAIDRASVAMRLYGECTPESADDVHARAVVGDGLSVVGSESGGDLRSLALIVLVKARLKQGDTTGARAQVETLLQTKPKDTLLLASVCEELAAQGTKFHAPCVRILEHIVQQIVALPAAAATGAGTGSARCGGGASSAGRKAGGAGSRVLPASAEPASSVGPAPVGGASCLRPERLAAAVRALVEMRLKAGASEAAEARAAARLGQDGDGTELVAGAAGAGLGAGSATDWERLLTLHRAVLADLQCIATRAGHDGAGVCDDPSYIEWLSDTAWNLAVAQASLRDATHNNAQGGDGGRGHGDGTADGTVVVVGSGSGGEDAGLARRSKASFALCAELAEASCELTNALPPTEARLHAMIRCQAVVCRCRLRLSALCAAEPEEHENLSHASSAIAAAFRLHHRWSQAAAVGLAASEAHAATATATATVYASSAASAGDGCVGPAAGGAAPPPPTAPPAAPELAADLVPTLQLLNFEVALLRRDPSARAVLERVAALKSVSAAQLEGLADDCLRARQRELGVLALEKALARLQASARLMAIDCS